MKSLKLDRIDRNLSEYIRTIREEGGYSYDLDPEVLEEAQDVVREYRSVVRASEEYFQKGEEDTSVGTGVAESMEDTQILMNGLMKRVIKNAANE